MPPFYKWSIATRIAVFIGLNSASKRYSLRQTPPSNTALRASTPESPITPTAKTRSQVAGERCGGRATAYFCIEELFRFSERCLTVPQHLVVGDQLAATSCRKSCVFSSQIKCPLTLAKGGARHVYVHSDSVACGWIALRSFRADRGGRFRFCRCFRRYGRSRWWQWAATERGALSSSEGLHLRAHFYPPATGLHLRDYQAFRTC